MHKVQEQCKKTDGKTIKQHSTNLTSENVSSENESKASPVSQQNEYLNKMWTIVVSLDMLRWKADKKISQHPISRQRNTGNKLLLRVGEEAFPKDKPLTIQQGRL